MHADAVERAVSLFRQGFLCSQAVLAAFAPRYGLDEPTALRLSCAYGSGVARAGETCGAVSGALMAIGLAHGSAAAGDHAAKERTYALARELRDTFRDREGSLLCRELIRFDLSTAAGLKAASESGVFQERCPAFVRSAAELVAGLLDAPRAP